MHGNFIWHELITTDTEAAKAFYGAVAGWEAEVTGVAGFDYTLFKVPGYDMAVAGLMTLTPEMAERKVPPNWSGYVAVEDVDAMVGVFAEEGGNAIVAPQDIPNIGRFAVVADPQGAVICLFRPTMPDGPLPPAPPPGSPGTFGWHELFAVDGASAFAFYAKMFGWQKDMAVDMGAAGTYQCFAVDGRPIGGIMTKMAEMPVPFWNYYINVDAIDAAAERVKVAGGKLINDPMEVPGGSWIVNCCDPQGAMISLLAPQR